jgi:hypothetical protein
MHVQGEYANVEILTQRVSGFFVQKAAAPWIRVIPTSVCYGEIEDVAGILKLSAFFTIRSSYASVVNVELA